MHKPILGALVVLLAFAMAGCGSSGGGSSSSGSSSSTSSSSGGSATATDVSNAYTAIFAGVNAAFNGTSVSPPAVSPAGQAGTSIGQAPESAPGTEPQASMKWFQDAVKQRLMHKLGVVPETSSCTSTGTYQESCTYTNVAGTVRITATIMLGDGTTYKVGALISESATITFTGYTYSGIVIGGSLTLADACTSPTGPNTFCNSTTTWTGTMNVSGAVSVPFAITYNLTDNFNGNTVVDTCSGYIAVGSTHYNWSSDCTVLTAG